ncbi:MAG: L-rhamnose/proton symporter RhaT, partial [Planctomycetota bacterium]
MAAGIALTMLGAFFLGTFALPIKYIKKYEWENTWGAFFLFAMFIIPIGFAALVVKDFCAGYANISGLVIFYVVGLSFLWGCGFCCWGTGLSMVGLSLGYSLTMGTMAFVGSMVPLFLIHADKAFTGPGLVIIAGILVCIVGVGINGYAGVQREKSQGGGETEGSPGGKRMLLGLIVCVLAGLLSSGLNIAFVVGDEWYGIAKASKALGNAPWAASLSTWTLIFIGGGISSVAYSLILLFKNKSWGKFKVEGSGKNLFFAFLMAAGHFACIIFYGVGKGE